MAIRGVAFVCLASLISAQQINSAHGVIPATSGTVTPAAAVVAAKGNFAWESVQLTQSVLTNLTNLNLTNIALFKYPTSTAASTSQCKVFPGDADWPGPVTWEILNILSGDALIKTVPLAAPCFTSWPEYNATECAIITSSWSDPHLHVANPTSAQWPLYEGLTCVPPSLRSEATNCTIGGYAAYSINVTNVAQIQLALNFARNLNLRLVVRNTGHDFADKSVGAGSLSLWTRNLDSLEFYKDYTYGSYSGPAFVMGAGVETADVYLLAEQNNVTAVGGECRTVGIAGGYIAGGGHSPMSSLKGMAADQVLFMKVVLPSGEFVTASATENPDLFWALRGGGGSTFGVVTSVVVMAYPKIPVTTMTFSYSISSTISADTFWNGLGVYMKYFPTFPDAGSYGYFNIAPNAAGNLTFTFDPFWGANMTKIQTQALVAPYLSDLAKLGIAVTPVYTEYQSLYPAWNASFPPEVVGGWTNHAGSRLFPRENFVNATLLNETLAVVRHAIEGGAILVGYNIKSAVNPHANQNNSVNPAWRETLTHFILPGLWDADATFAQIQNVSETLTNDWLARWRAVSPGAGSYFAEGDINEPDFQQSFYGSYYPQLLAMKKEFDPWDLFYAPTAVGSEYWYITGQIPYIPTQNGRLCRKT
ncbi:FAD-binding domain-containing protein [Mollisia scopiformis]|uniref:FAD-binding domain-containing protein n=1 Tax=Mollisia scopiformis TaxID=149040 RepID=A0A194WTN6_MOLSC|nr:FAD-binding domain-containing protein [Mollisia scopiformis]KUJ11049.1 FAD-binding domain-containing protein [Mollisia scopiformis]